MLMAWEGTRWVPGMRDYTPRGKNINIGSDKQLSAKKGDLVYRSDKGEQTSDLRAAKSLKVGWEWRQPRLRNQEEAVCALNWITSVVV